MSWNYRILRHQDGTLALHEVHYDQHGRPRAYTAEPTRFVVDADEGAEGLRASLERALHDARTRSVIDAVAMGGPRKVEDLDDDTVAAIAGSAIPDEFAHLDKIIEDWKL
jgi:hypothetical protein